MAGVPGQTPEQRLAYAKSVAGPRGTVREEQRAGITDYIPVPPRDRERSVLGEVGSFADKYMGFGDDRRRSRILSGIASQWYGLDEGGNPSAGETPGLVFETKALGALPATLARVGLDAYSNWYGKTFLGLPDGKVLEDPLYNLVKKTVLSDPEWATRAAEKADAIHKAVREDMHLKAAHGFEQNFDESLGVMLGQLPIPGKLATKGVEGAAAAPSALRRIEQGAEWFTPTVEPKVGNYLTGAITGGAIGTLGDEEETPVVLPDEDQPGAYDVRPIYGDGSVGYSGSHDDQAALNSAEAQDAARAEGRPRRTNFNSGGYVDKCDGGMSTVKSMKAKYAEGGKVNSALKAIKDAIAHLDNGDTPSALRVLQNSPAALQDPGIVAAMAKLRRPTTLKGGRQVLDSAVAADTNANKVATFAKGGKVSAVEAMVDKARMTLADAKKVVRSHGHTLVKSDGEYIVKKSGERTRIEGDDSHYFTDDLQDAVGTSAAMAKQRAGLKP